VVDIPRRECGVIPRSPTELSAVAGPSLRAKPAGAWTGSDCRSRAWRPRCPSVISAVCPGPLCSRRGSGRHEKDVSAAESPP